MLTFSGILTNVKWINEFGSTGFRIRIKSFAYAHIFFRLRLSVRGLCTCTLSEILQYIEKNFIKFWEDLRNLKIQINSHFCYVFGVELSVVISLSASFKSFVIVISFVDSSIVRS